MQFIYINMQHNYVDKQHDKSTCEIFYPPLPPNMQDIFLNKQHNYVIYVNMQHGFVDI